MPLSKPRTVLVLLLIIFSGSILRLNNLSGRSLWTDEFFTLFQASGHGMDVEVFEDTVSHMDVPPVLKPSDLKVFIENDPGRNIKDVTAGLLKTDTHPPLYFWAIHLWMIIFGDGVFALRFFSVLMGVFSIFLAYKVGERLFGSRAGLFCSLFTAISPFSVRYSQEARAYSMIMAIGLLSSLFLLKLERDNRSRDALFFSLSTAAGLYTHYFYAFTAIAHFAYFNATHFRDDSRLRKFYLSALTALLLFSPWMVCLLIKGYNFADTEWIFGYPGITGKIGDIFLGLAHYCFVLYGFGILWGLLMLAGALSFVYIAGRGMKDAFTGYRRQSFFCFSLLVIPLLAMLWLDIFQHGAFLRQERFWMFSFLGFIPLTGYFLKSGFSRGKITFTILLACILASSLMVNRGQCGPAAKDICGWLNSQSRGKKSAVIVCSKRGAAIPQSYYLDDGICMIPVSSREQLIKGVEAGSGVFDQIFIVRHYHPTDNSLLNEPFMELYYIGKDFSFEKKVNSCGVSASQFVKRAI
jgi:uncharacterized membrane protein